MGSDEHLFFSEKKKKKEVGRDIEKNPAWGCLLINHRTVVGSFYVLSLVQRFCFLGSLRF